MHTNNNKICKQTKRMRINKHQDMKFTKIEQNMMIKYRKVSVHKWYKQIMLKAQTMQSEIVIRLSNAISHKCWILCYSMVMRTGTASKRRAIPKINTESSSAHHFQQIKTMNTLTRSQINLVNTNNNLQMFRKCITSHYQFNKLRNN